MSAQKARRCSSTLAAASRDQGRAGGATPCLSSVCPGAEELLPVLGGDDPHGMGRPAMAKGLDWNLRQSRLFRTPSPSFGQAEKRRAGLSPGWSDLGARRTGHGPDQPDRFRTKEDPSPAFAAPVPLGAGHSNPGIVLSSRHYCNDVWSSSER